MIIVSGILKLTPEDLARVRSAAQAVIAATRAEPGCLVYSFADDLMEPGLVRIYEEWESREDLSRHGKSDHVAEWHRALEGVTVLERRLEIIDVASREPLD
ncbi:putative quinol monooxygenase [Fulvimarina sp. MAC8]|uniref:putative quinol monooxygenase n=1 Tax=Fulvimarina sp. MAC8 TaxID=3162874 RepID=UPI0032EF97B6